MKTVIGAASAAVLTAISGAACADNILGIYKADTGLAAQVEQGGVSISGTVEGGQDTCEFISHKCSFKDNILSCALDDDPSLVLPLRFASNTQFEIADQDAVPVNSMACGAHAWLSGKYQKVSAPAQQPQGQGQAQGQTQGEGQGSNATKSEQAFARIDAQFKQCAENGGSEEGMYKCLEAAEKQADAILNQNYKAFARICESSGDKNGCLADLKSMEQSWIKYRDGKCKLMNDVYSEGDPTCLYEETKRQSMVLDPQKLGH